MPRANETQKAERLNRARKLLQQVDQLADAVAPLAQDCSISPRQARRYLQQAQGLARLTSYWCQSNAGQSEQWPRNRPDKPRR